MKERDGFIIGIRIACGIGAVLVFYWMVTKPQADLEKVSACMVFTFIMTRLADIAAGTK